MARPMEKITMRFLVLLGMDPDRMIKWCIDIELIAGRYKCPRCGADMQLTKRMDMKDQRQWRCNKSDHDIRRSVRKGSWFEKSKLEMYEILTITYLWCWKQPFNFIMNELNLSPSTVVEWMGFCRDVCMNIVVSDNEMLGGEDVIVEVNVTKFRGKNVKDNLAEEKWVFGGVERGTNKCFMVLLNVIKKYVHPGSTIISDCCRVTTA